MSAIRYVGVFASIALLTVLAALPWGLPAEDRFFLPLLPVVAIHYWALRQPEALPEWFVFAAGFLLDVFTHGPLGYWPLVYLTAYALGVLSEEAGHASAFVRLALFLAALAAVAVFSWLLASFYFLEWADWRPYAQGAGLAAGAALIIVPLLHLIAEPEANRGAAQLTRGG